MSAAIPGRTYGEVVVRLVVVVVVVAVRLMFGLLRFVDDSWITADMPKERLINQEEHLNLTPPFPSFYLRKSDLFDCQLSLACCLATAPA